MSPRRNAEAPNTFGDEVAVKMSQRTLILILGTAVAAAIAWMDLKSTANKNRESIVDLIAVRAQDLQARQADHDLLVRVASGVDQLQKRADREDRRNGTTHN